eukprot:gene5550-16554_t
MGDRGVMVNGRVLSVDDIMWGYELVTDARLLLPKLSWLGVTMQQDPTDAVAIQQV